MNWRTSLPGRRHLIASEKIGQRQREKNRQPDESKRLDNALLVPV
jgi:hypothetical protein